MSRTSPRISSKALLAIQLAVVGGVALAYASLPARGKESVRDVVLRTTSAPTVELPRTQPLSVEPLFDVPELVSDDELAGVLKKLQPKFPRAQLKPNFVEHALRTWGISAQFQDPAVMSGVEMMDFLVNHGAYLKSWGENVQPLLEDEADGIAVRIGSDPNESVHHDHWLASLTEAGVSLDQRVDSPGRPNGTINDVLQQALRDFRLDEREVEWSAMAFGLWLPPVREWRTTGGRTVSFDTLARRLIRGDKRLGVCHGTHRVYSLALLLRLDDAQHILSPEVRQEVWNDLAAVRELLKVSQFDDGHWPSDWARGKGAVEEPINDVNYRKVIATGHHLEWLSIAPEELHPPREQILRAARWVVEDTLAKSEAEILERYTFYSHVANALALWRGTHPADFFMTWETRQSAPDLPPPPAP